MEVKKVSISAYGYPSILATIPDPPKQLFYRGNEFAELLKQPRVAIVGSRKITPYGRAVTQDLAAQLARHGVIIISGLAYGVDAIAHQAALEAGGTAIAVLASGLDTIYPSAHRSLAQRILDQGGALVSEYPPGTVAYKTNFIARNRIVSGLSDGVLIPEAAIKSGTLHTARFALEQGREVMAVPGNITSINSGGANRLIRDGATPITELADVLLALGLEYRQRQLIIGSNEHEQCLIDLISSGHNTNAALLAQSQLPATIFSQTITMLELTSKIRSIGSGAWALGP